MLSLVQVFQYKKNIGKGSVKLSSESATTLRSSELRIQFNQRLFTYQRFMLKANRQRDSINAVEGGRHARTGQQIKHLLTYKIVQQIRV